jgi:Tfp pilus assembly protein PilO
MEIQIPKQISSKTAMTSFKKAGHRAPSGFILVIVVIGLLSWFMVVPKYSEYKKLSSNSQKIQDEKDTLDSNLKTLENLVSILKNSKSEVEKLDEALPLRDSNVRLQQFLQDLANSSGVTVGSIGLSEQSSEPDSGDKALLNKPFSIPRSLQKVSANIYIIGTFEQLQAFLEKLETSGRIIDASSVSISANPDGNGLLDLRMLVDLYYFGPTK